MEYIEKIKKMLCKELDEYAMKGKLTMADLEAVHKLTDTVKNLDKIAMLEEESGGYSEARGGRGRGRSSYEGGSSYDDYSEEGSYRGGSSYERGGQGGSSYRGGSSYAEGKDRMMSRLGEMMEDADPKEREALKECMRAIERA